MMYVKTLLFFVIAIVICDRLEQTLFSLNSEPRHLLYLAPGSGSLEFGYGSDRKRFMELGNLFRRQTRQS